MCYLDCDVCKCQLFWRNLQWSQLFNVDKFVTFYKIIYDNIRTPQISLFIHISHVIGQKYLKIVPNKQFAISRKMQRT